MIRSCLITALMLVGVSMLAQVASEEEVIMRALQNHPSILMANTEVQKSRALERTSFNPEQPRFEIETPSDFGIGFEAEQEFSFPTVYMRRADLFKSQTRLAEEALSISRIELAKNVRLAYLEAQVAQESFRYANSVDSLWHDIAGQSQRLYDAGEINLGDVVFAQNRAGLVRVTLMENSALLANKLFVLENYTGAPVDSVEPLYALPYTPAEGTNYFFENYMAQQNVVTQNEIDVYKSHRLPGLMIGYLRSDEIDTEHRFRYKAGITVPIWQGQYTGQIKASRLETERAAAELTLRRQEAEIARHEWENLLEQTQQNLAWFENTAIPQMNQLVDIYTRLYNAGEINYTQMLRNIADAFVIRDEYLNLIQRHNQAIIQLDYLNGKQ